MLAFPSRGYQNDTVTIFPTSITVGGQTVNALTSETEASGSAGNTGSILYECGESVIAAMGDGSKAFTLTYTETLQAAYEVPMTFVFMQDVDQTAGVVDSDQIANAGASASLSLTTVAGDWCLGFGDMRGDLTVNSLGSGMTAVDTTASSGNLAEESNQRIDRITASGTSTSVQMGFPGSSEQGALHAVVYREDTGGGGGGGGNLPLLHALGEAA